MRPPDQDLDSADKIHLLSDGRVHSYLPQNKYLHKLNYYFQYHYFHLFYFTKEQIGGRVTVTSRYDSGYVKQARIEGKKTITLGGEAFRKRYGLPSSCFFVENGKKEVRITTKGIGHGFGLSQSMADSLAKEGKDAKEILKYFFRNVEFYQNE